MCRVFVAAEFASGFLEAVDAGVADPMLGAQLSHRNAGLMLLQNPDDLFFRKSGCASWSGPLLGPERTSNWINPEGQCQSQAALGRII